MVSAASNAASATLNVAYGEYLVLNSLCLSKKESNLVAVPFPNNFLLWGQAHCRSGIMPAYAPVPHLELFSFEGSTCVDSYLNGMPYTSNTRCMVTSTVKIHSSMSAAIIPQIELNLNFGISPVLLCLAIGGQTEYPDPHRDC